jgi:hypothetical protein
MSSLTIDSRFRGPTRSGNGGYVCGAVAAYADGPVTVKLRQPPPLDTPMTVDRDGEGILRVSHDQRLIAEAAPRPDPPGPLAPLLPGPVSLDEVRSVAGRARYFEDPYFPDCFVCGTNRQVGDGLRIFPGPMAGRPMWAAPWTPDPSVASPEGTVRPEVIWAALDCPSGIAAGEGCGLPEDTAIVLGQMTASLPVLPKPGDQCQVIAWPAGRDGRKLTAGSALLGPGGEVLAIARTLWITVPRSVRAASAR